LDALYLVTDASLDPANCQLAATSTQTNFDSQGVGHGGIFDSISLSLKDIEEVQLEAQNFTNMEFPKPVWSLKLIEAQPRIKRSQFEKNKSGKPQKIQTVQLNSTEFHFIDNDLARRVAKAFAYAVHLCGGGPPNNSKKPGDPF
jgi:hypothetical protein